MTEPAGTRRPSPVAQMARQAAATVVLVVLWSLFWGWVYANLRRAGLELPWWTAPLLGGIGGVCLARIARRLYPMPGG